MESFFTRMAHLTLHLHVACLVTERAALEKAMVAAAPSATCTPTVSAEEHLALLMIGHRGASDWVERLYCEGLAIGLADAARWGLPRLGAEWDSDRTTRDLKTPRPELKLQDLLSRPLLHTTDGNLGADVVFVTPQASPRSYLLTLVQLKRGNTPIGGSKSTTGVTNRGRSAFYIHQRLETMAGRLRERLRTHFQVANADVATHLVLVTTAAVNGPARAFLKEKEVLVLEGHETFIDMMPARTRAILRSLAPAD